MTPRFCLNCTISLGYKPFLLNFKIFIYFSFQSFSFSETGKDACVVFTNYLSKVKKGVKRLLQIFKRQKVIRKNLTCLRYISLFFRILSTVALPAKEGRSAGCWLRIDTMSFLVSCTSSLNIAHTCEAIVTYIVCLTITWSTTLIVENNREHDSRWIFSENMLQGCTFA